MKNRLLRSIDTTAHTHSPATPDDEVDLSRLEGRLAARSGKSVSDNPFARGKKREMWFLGYLDVREERFYKCGSSQS